MSRLVALAVALAVLHEASPGLAQSTDAGSPPPPEPPASEQNNWFDPPSAVPQAEPKPEPEPELGPAPPPPTSPVVECVPACGDGSVCMNGKCVRPASPGAATAKDTWTLPSRRNKAGDYRHDGFYARLSLGGGYSWGSGNVRPLAVEGDSSTSDSLELEGGAFGVVLLVGGTLPGGVAIGFAAISTLAGDPTYETPNGEQRGGDMGQSLAGLFADWYPDPTGGLHLLVAAGLGGATLYEGVSVPRRELGASGFALAAGGGYDLFVGRDFSLGVLPLFQYGRAWFTRIDSDDEGSVETMALTLHFAMTYN